jgi:hypothetical protein
MKNWQRKNKNHNQRLTADYVDARGFRWDADYAKRDTLQSEEKQISPRITRMNANMSVAVLQKFRFVEPLELSIQSGVC